MLLSLNRNYIRAVNVYESNIFCSDPVRVLKGSIV